MMCSNFKSCAVLCVVLLFAVIGSSYAAVFTQPAALHPAYPGKCFDKITQRPMLPDKLYKPKGICAAMTCNLQQATIEIETCPMVDMPGCEELPSDSNWSFPKCCPRYVCTDFKTGKDIIFDASSA